MNSTLMWPHVNINSTTVTRDNAVLSDIEEYFSALYSPYKVIYFSRARVALMAISAAKRLSRPQRTFVQPFSSHCVLSAVSHLSTPTTTQPQDSDQQVIYHQWGYKTLANKETYSNVLVEDAVDSLILSNEHFELFPNNAPFCIISLPKICEASIGAIVVCQQAEDYQQLKAERDDMRQDIDSILSNINTAIFQEPIFQAVPTLVPIIRESIQTLIESAAEKVQSNLAYINHLYPKLALTQKLSNRRLPSNVIIKQAQYTEQELFSKVPFEIAEQQRTFFNYQAQQTEKVWLLPCHFQAEWT